MTPTSKHHQQGSELERVARAGWAVTLRYRLLVTAVAPQTETNMWMKAIRWSLPAGALGTYLCLKYG
jgi:hypothetical protein